ncbi:predicted protein [Streptomyces viridochromogenes DSM 40736]|uniref:Predicted protein n=1 Tax=Streptomyces viridochromogenes (strain DSM 40736 / JCM 4977 / BCRC 1201 / Tue 494) TaxID=591159 RepID=D9X5N4_STRVT|nr:hypothetical protein [Streptomyces viridochromogenes]EFL36015.1 predicted protein [Streptomyces viridochromogenes DSM 40736]
MAVNRRNNTATPAPPAATTDGTPHSPRRSVREAPVQAPQTPSAPPGGRDRGGDTAQAATARQVEKLDRGVVSFFIGDAMPTAPRPTVYTP